MKQILLLLVCIALSCTANAQQLVTMNRNRATSATPRTNAHSSNYGNRKVRQNNLQQGRKDPPKLAQNIRNTRKKTAPKRGHKSNTLLNGYNRIVEEDGAVYEGYFVNGSFCGQGTYTLPDGLSFSGQFKDDVPNGECTITLNDGTVYYKGNMLNGEIYGHGVMLRGEGVWAEADWSDNGNTAQNARVYDREGNTLFYGNISNGLYTDGLLYQGYNISIGHFGSNGKWVSTGYARKMEVEEDKVVFTVWNVEFTMIKVERGTFVMGSSFKTKNPFSSSEPYGRETPEHYVTLSKDYYIGETEVTQQLWNALMEKNPSNFAGLNNPVDNVTSNLYETFLEKLNDFLEFDFRLPTEAEWEYAAMGGRKSKHTKYSGSDKLDEVGWYYENSSNWTRRVKTKKPNELGIYDMTGNVWEICQDYYRDYSTVPSKVDPIGLYSDYGKVWRGGCAGDPEKRCRLKCRMVPYKVGIVSGKYGYYYAGIRLCLSAGGESEDED